MNLNAITMGMTPQEKETYFEHLEKRQREEAAKIDAEKAAMKAYKERLIENILKNHNDFTYEELSKKSVRTLERIW